MGRDWFSGFGACSRTVRAVRWQDIVDRRGTRIGCECLIRLAGVPGRDTGEAVSRLPAPLLNSMTSELLHRMSLNCLRSPNASRDKPPQIFLNIEKRTLSCAGAVDELIETSRCFKISGYELVVEVTQRPLPDMSSFRMYIDGLLRLKEAGVFVALDAYSLSKEHIELELELADLVKFDIDSLGIPLDPYSSDFFGGVYGNLQDQLYAFIRLYRVPLLAQKVETLWQSRVVADLPFYYFQGYHFGKPFPVEDGVMPTMDETFNETRPRQGLWVDLKV